MSQKRCATKRLLSRPGGRLPGKVLCIKGIERNDLTNIDFRRVIASRTRVTFELQSESQLIYQPPCSRDGSKGKGSVGVRRRTTSFRLVRVSGSLRLLSPVGSRSPLHAEKEMETRADSYERRLIHRRMCVIGGFLDD